MPDLWATEGRIFSVGHSARKRSDFINLLKDNGIELLIDVRHFPGSRRHPWFNREVLGASLKEHGIDYLWLGEELGGFRKGGYEAHMETEAFKNGLARLMELAKGRRVAFACAEASETRCHRKYIARELEKKGWEVVRLN